MPIISTSAAPTRPGQITSTKGSKEPDVLLPKKPPSERAFGCSAPALIETATQPVVQATALDWMVANTRKTPSAPPMLIGFRSVISLSDVFFQDYY
jgi:hypothetical protein